MVRITTPVHVDALPSLTHSEGVVAVGSCFVQAMGVRLQRAGFDALVNPHGTLFNPLSIVKTIRHALWERLPSEGDFIARGDRCAHTDYHSDLARGTIAESLEAIAHAHGALREHLGRASWLILTLGTAWVYRREDGDVATNCHKLPSALFTRELLPVGVVVEALQGLAGELRSLNPELKVLLTVSPVRHLNDGLRENAVSKSSLLLAVHQVRTSLRNVYYFPSYELLVDELRDYRYYADDLVHPSHMAEEIVWERLQDAWFSMGTRQLAQRHEALARSLAHRPTSVGSQEYRRFVERMVEEMEELQRLTPLRSYGAELQRLRESVPNAQAAEGGQ